MNLLNDEVELIAKAQRGEKEALNTLVIRYWQPIYRLIYYKINHTEDAQELTQETFFKAFRALPRYQQAEASFKTYLGRIALNLVNDFWRKKGRSPQVIDIAEYQEPLIDSSPNPDEAALDAEQQREIGRLIALLPDEQRQAVELRIIAGLSVREVARIMGKTEPALKMLQQRALKNLRKMFIERGIQK
ncbi:MAG: sigma-70 family RNA polymerase sigma factor [Negativicutes bacterium]|nr:sigma-70 family RNA polymerase sigma factor [Negativicutes bacterium]